jgi:NAD(P)-dependent dehydrogenase (short-subunit alcohol dehydrogenase family)
VHYHTSREAAREVAAGIERAGGRAGLLAADVREPGRVEALMAESVEALGGLDVLVNNAGGMVRRAPLEAHLREIPMGRIGSPEECAGVYLFLASDRLSGYVTGQVIEVNGGQLMP